VQYDCRGVVRAAPGLANDVRPRPGSDGTPDRAKVTDADEMTLDTRSSKTVRVEK
jgi:hypothetical protein